MPESQPNGLRFCAGPQRSQATWWDPRQSTPWPDRLGVQLGACDSQGEAFIPGKSDDMATSMVIDPVCHLEKKTLTQTMVSQSAPDLGEAARGGSEGSQRQLLELSHAGEGGLRDSRVDSPPCSAHLYTAQAC